MYTHSELIFVYNPHLIPIESHLYNPHTFAVGETLIDRSSMCLLFFVHIHCQCHFAGVQEGAAAGTTQHGASTATRECCATTVCASGLEMRT